MQVTLRVRRFNPETDSESRIETYDVLADPMDRVLDLLHWVKRNVDGSLTFRRSCAHGICGSDAMLINGTNRPACKVLVREVGDQITVEPLRGLPVNKDLLVDMEPFFASYREVLPYLVNDEPAPTPSGASPRPTESASTTPPSILCAACTTSCPVFWADEEYRPGGDRQRPPLHLRLPRPGRRPAPDGAERQGGRLAPPDHLQLHRRLAPRHQGHPGHPGSEAGPAVPQGVTLIPPATNQQS